MLEAKRLKLMSRRKLIRNLGRGFRPGKDLHRIVRASVPTQRELIPDNSTVRNVSTQSCCTLTRKGGESLSLQVTGRFCHAIHRTEPATPIKPSVGFSYTWQAGIRLPFSNTLKNKYLLLLA